MIASCKTRLLLAGTVALALACAAFAPAAKAANGNILLVTADDFGQDAAWASPAWPATLLPRAPQPNLTALANRGITFGNFDAHMECSPSRAAILTGQYAFRPQNGVAEWISDARVDLPNEAFTLFDAFTASAAGQRYRRAHIGKLHLYHGADGRNAPLAQGGINDFSGPLPGGGIRSFYRWQNTTNGVARLSTIYATTLQTDLAIAQVTKVDSRPYFVSVNYNAPHTIDGGYERPPNELHNYDTIPAGPVDDQIHFDAVVQALDTELGRLLARVDFATTTVIFMGDNGTRSWVRRQPYGFRGCKSSIYQCGVAVPFVLAGKGIAGTVPRVDLRLAQDVDVFSTILQLAGINQASVVPAGRVIDGQSLVPYMTSTTGSNGRVYSYNETFTGTWTNHAIRSMRGGRYKLVTRGARQELYRTASDPHETRNLIGTPLNAEATEARARLLAEMNALLATR